MATPPQFWSGAESAAFRLSARNLAIVAACTAALFGWFFLVGNDTTVVLRAMQPMGSGQDGVQLITEPPGQYFVPASMRPQRPLQPGCRYRINHRPAEFGKGLTRASNWRVVKSLTLVECPDAAAQ